MADMLFFHYSMWNAVANCSPFIHIAAGARMDSYLLNIDSDWRAEVFFLYCLFHLQLQREPKIIKISIVNIRTKKWEQSVLTVMKMGLMISIMRF